MLFVIRHLSFVIRHSSFVICYGTVGAGASCIWVTAKDSSETRPGKTCHGTSLQITKFPN
ncbi:hypothetical protein [Coleofasciculus sp. F4-SAH-05]|uniref:hypothetical protein n=1 Tax=Coleofasciculus sp. F4-SAH-05 TaxID=3069525 RepID=UPI0032FD412B